MHSFLGRKSHPRPDVAALLPRDVRSVLDIGCGEGAFGAALERDGVRVIGIEHDLEAARVAESRLTRVFAADVDDVLDELGEGVDAIVLADVLEHLRDPLGVLALLADRARDATRLVVSVPNAAHASVLAGLLQGRFDPALEGIVAEDHVTYAGRLGWVALLAAGGWEVETETAVRMLPPTAEPWAAALRTVVPAEESGNLDVLQWLFRARKAPKRTLEQSLEFGTENHTAFDEDDPMSLLSELGAQPVELPNAASGLALDMLLSCGLATGRGAETLRRGHTEKGLRRRLSSRWVLDLDRSGGPLTGRVAVAADAAAALGLPVDRQALETDVLRVRVSPP